MSVKSKLNALLTGDSAVTALVADRIQPAPLGQNPTMPAITFQRIGGAPIYSSKGVSGLGNPQLQIDCWGITSKQADDVALAVVESIDGATTFGGILRNQWDGYEDETLLYRVSMDWSLWDKET